MSQPECRCQIVGWSRDPYEPHIPAQAEWEQADDCSVHPLRETGLCRVCMFSPRAHEIVVRRGIFPAHGYDVPIPPAATEREAGR